MKILLLNADSKWPNLALAKIELYHKKKRDQVIWNLPELWQSFDKIYLSCLFDFNKDLCDLWKGIADIGGSGYSLTKTLPPEIDSLKPKINVGFTTRGCFRNCEFCIVPKKEGKLHAVGDLYDLWDGHHPRIDLIDNNILGMPEHFFKICAQAKKENLILNFSQGLDCRLLTPAIAKELNQIKYPMHRFAFDSWEYHEEVIRAIQLIKEAKIKRVSWFVYLDEKWEDALLRLSMLKKYKQHPFVLRNAKILGKKKYTVLASWANSQKSFYGMDFYDYIEYGKNRRKNPEPEPKPKKYIPRQTLCKYFIENPKSLSLAKSTECNRPLIRERTIPRKWRKTPSFNPKKTQKKSRSLHEIMQI